MTVPKLSDAKMFQLPVQIHGVRTLSDGGLEMKLHTQELAPDEMAKIFDLKGKLVWAAVKENEVKPDDLDIPENMPEFKGDKTPGQRLRAVLFVYWEQNKPTKEFDEFYKQRMNAIIDQIKEKLV